MIVAVGIDLVDLSRIAEVWAAHPERFLTRHFAPEEIAYCRSRPDPLPSLAARFAAKEAFQKCWPESHGWRDVWVVREGARPTLAFVPALAGTMVERRWRAHLSLTHSRDQAGAVVVLEQLDPT
jgi:holo-[acyl-carrier protein] synthase